MFKKFIAILFVIVTVISMFAVASANNDIVIKQVEDCTWAFQDGYAICYDASAKVYDVYGPGMLFLGTITVEEYEAYKAPKTETKKYEVIHTPIPTQTEEEAIVIMRSWFENSSEDKGFLCMDNKYLGIYRTENGYWSFYERGKWGNSYGVKNGKIKFAISNEEYLVIVITDGKEDCLYVAHQTLGYYSMGFGYYTTEKEIQNCVDLIK